MYDIYDITELPIIDDIILKLARKIDKLCYFIKENYGETLVLMLIIMISILTFLFWTIMAFGIGYLAGFIVEIILKILHIHFVYNLKVIFGIIFVISYHIKRL